MLDRVDFVQLRSDMLEVMQQTADRMDDVALQMNELPGIFEGMFNAMTSVKTSGTRSYNNCRITLRLKRR